MQAERVLTDAQYHVQFSFDTLYTTHMHRLCSDNSPSCGTFWLAFVRVSPSTRHPLERGSRRSAAQKIARSRASGQSDEHGHLASDRRADEPLVEQ
jgi:hypothetical protein